MPSEPRRNHDRYGMPPWQPIIRRPGTRVVRNARRFTVLDRYPRATADWFASHRVDPSLLGWTPLDPPERTQELQLKHTLTVIRPEHSRKLAIRSRAPSSGVNRRCTLTKFRSPRANQRSPWAGIPNPRYFAADKPSQPRLRRANSASHGTMAPIQEPVRAASPKFSHLPRTCRRLQNILSIARS